MVLNVRKRQRDALVKLLHFNEDASQHAIGSEPFKILVIDSFTLKVVATLLHTEALRQNGVTLVLTLDKEREAVSDAPVVYFVRADNDNVASIARDLEQGLYKEAHVNFASWAPRALLETLAKRLVAAATPTAVAAVYDQYLSFISLESTLFSLGLESSYVELNSPRASDASIEAAVGAVVDGLFSVCVTLSAVPVIRAPPGGLAEHVARALADKLADHLRGRSSALFSDASVLAASVSRPVLCLFDRNFDLIPMVEQPFTYKALVHDCLGMRQNKVTIGSTPGATKKLSIEIGEDDAFWAQNGHQEFGVAAAEVDAQVERMDGAAVTSSLASRHNRSFPLQLKAYQEVLNSVSKRNGASDASDADEAHLVEEATKALMTTVKSLPELRAQKRKLDNHMNLLYTLLNEIKRRALDQYHELGKRVLAGDAAFADINKMLQGTVGDPGDKLRLALLYLLTADVMPSDADMAVMTAALQAVNADVAALQYVKRMRAMNLTGSAASGAGGGGGGTGTGGTSLLGGLMDSGLVANIAGSFGKQLSKLVGNTRQALMISAVAQLMDNQPSRQGGAVSAAETFISLDPKAQAGRAEVGEGMFLEAIVFVVGGGNYLERERLSQWAQSCTPKRNVIYGATDMVTGSELCAQLAEIERHSV